MATSSDARVWLRNHGYEAVADRIDAIMTGWRLRGVKTRRNWWLVLAGTPLGTPCLIDGMAFPILAAARRRMGLPPTAGAEERTPGEIAPGVRVQGRWPCSRSDVSTDAS